MLKFDYSLVACSFVHAENRQPCSTSYHVHNMPEQVLPHCAGLRQTTTTVSWYAAGPVRSAADFIRYCTSRCRFAELALHMIHYLYIITIRHNNDVVSSWSMHHILRRKQHL